MTCCGGICSCGSGCPCGSGCRGYCGCGSGCHCGRGYGDCKSENTTDKTPEAAENGCKCGLNCTYDPCNCK